ncbi:catalase-3 isoform X1 [Brassica rapa]|nr:catalase-3 isoform X1 [Brassica rapa]
MGRTIVAFHSGPPLPSVVHAIHYIYLTQDLITLTTKTSKVSFGYHQSLFITMDPYKYRPSSAYNSPFYTTNGGAPVSNNISSLTIGERGPVLLEDYHLIEKVANFTRERIPERVVHARGISAKGFFEVTHDISNLTCADFLRAPGVQTPVIVRFSTVVHERASPETMRDIRGFAVKFYTREGNFDLVGNNTPVFFIRDGIQFPDVVHALKPNPKTNIQEYWRILDYMSHLPESLLTWCWMFDDVGIPQDYRHMEGFGVHTYTLVSKSGKVLFVKFHWKPTCGIKNLTDEEAKVVGGANHSHATKDLHDAIASGNYPEWKLFIQTMDPADEDKFDFDPLDVTKIWPEDILPLQPVGRLVLNRTIDNFFNETEQLAFNPGLVVPGIYYSDDKLLQCRIFAYGDTQRHRLGPNYLQLPVNAPKCAHHNNHHEGFMNFMHRDEEINYYPSKFDPVRCAEKVPIPNKSYTGIRTKCIIKKENNFKQPGDRYRSWAPDRQDRFVKRWVEILSEPRLTHEIRSIWISYWSQADRSLGQKLASRLNVRPSI